MFSETRDLLKNHIKQSRRAHNAILTTHRVMPKDSIQERLTDLMFIRITGVVRFYGVYVCRRGGKEITDDWLSEISKLYPQFRFDIEEGQGPVPQFATVIPRESVQVDTCFIDWYKWCYDLITDYLSCYDVVYEDRLKSPDINQHNEIIDSLLYAESLEITEVSGKNTFYFAFSNDAANKYISDPDINCVHPHTSHTLFSVYRKVNMESNNMIQDQEQKTVTPPVLNTITITGVELDQGVGELYRKLLDLPTRQATDMYAQLSRYLYDAGVDIVRLVSSAVPEVKNN